jgi:putative flippase GtrA
MTEKLFKLVRYVISGGTAATVTIASIFIFTHYFQIWYLASSVISYSLGFIVSFSLQKFWTFKSHSLIRWRDELAIYSFIFVINILVNSTIIYGLVEFLSIHYLIAQIISGAILALVNFFLYKHYVFIDVLPV